MIRPGTRVAVLMDDMAQDASGRQVWIDVARGIGISLVVLAHMSIPPRLTNYICAFHMPLFFFLSGLLYMKRPFAELVARRARTLLVPYFLFSLLALVVRDVALADSYRGIEYYGGQLLGMLYGVVDGPYPRLYSRCGSSCRYSWRR